MATFRDLTVLVSTPSRSSARPALTMVFSAYRRLVLAWMVLTARRHDIRTFGPPTGPRSAAAQCSTSNKSLTHAGWLAKP